MIVRDEMTIRVNNPFLNEPKATCLPCCVMKDFLLSLTSLNSTIMSPFRAWDFDSKLLTDPRTCSTFAIVHVPLGLVREAFPTPLT